MKKISITFIDNCSHGYYSVSKKDVLSLGILNKISRSSGLTLTRVYLEEDRDAALFFDKCMELGIEVNIKETYNPNFRYTNSFDVKLFNFVPKVGLKVFVGGKSYFITDVTKNNIIVDNMYRISLSNPFKYITDYE